LHILINNKEENENKKMKVLNLYIKELDSKIEKNQEMYILQIDKFKLNIDETDIELKVFMRSYIYMYSVYTI
jgi:hypothetical protein